MKFTCLPIRNMTVVIEPGKTKYFGPGQFEHEEGVNAVFTNGYLILDEYKPQSLEMIKKIIRHPQFGSDFKYVQESTPGFTADGRPAMVVGFTLKEAIENADRFFLEKKVKKEVEQGSVPPTVSPDFLDFVEPDPVLSSDLEAKETGGPRINTGAVSSADLQPKAKKPGVPRSKFVRPAEPVTEAAKAE